MSVAVGENALALANAARQAGAVFSARIPTALIDQLVAAGWVERSTTMMGTEVATELKFSPAAIEWIIGFFR